MKRTWIVHFRVVSPDDYWTPRTYLPEEVMGGFEADSAEQAWEEFLSKFPEQRGWFVKTADPEVQM